MSTATINVQEDIMTDFQFRAIMAMVLDMLDKCESIEDIEETKKLISKLSGNISANEADGAKQ